MKIKTAELIDRALDWAVAKCEDDMAPHGSVMLIGRQLFTPNDGELLGDGYQDYQPSTNWAQGGPIIEREGISIDCQFLSFQGDGYWEAKGVSHEDNETSITAGGPTPLIAAMRCYVASKLGDEVDVPEELI